MSTTMLTLCEYMLCTDSTLLQQGALVMGFETTGLWGNGMTMTNQYYDNDSVCFLSEERKDKEKEGDVSTQGTLVRGLE